jgi:hypothetical protein
MDIKTVQERLNDARNIVEYIETHYKDLTPQELVDAKTKLSIFYFYLSDLHTVTKKSHNLKWLELRKTKKTDKSTDMEISESQEWQMYDQVKYLLRGLEKLLSTLKDRLIVMENQAKNIW